MPQTLKKSTQLLGIRLDGEGDGAAYRPGDTIVGCVFRKTHIVSPEASIQISLHGRSKSKMVVTRGGNSSSTYRGRFNLIDERDTAQSIFDGPLHIPAHEEQVWPFTVTIPLHPNPKYLAPGVPQEQSYLPLDEESVAAHTLPPTYTWSSPGSTEGFVEYFLKAELQSSRENTVDTTEAILPLSIVNSSIDPPAVDFGLKVFRETRSVSSYRLIPARQQADLSIAQKMKQSLSLSTVPVYWFIVEMLAPSVIQLDSPTTIPFRIRAGPEYRRTTQTIQRVPQQIRLTSVNLKLESTTQIRCEGSFGPHEKQKEKEVELSSDGVVRKSPFPIDVCSPTFVDIGELLSLRLGQHSPTFETYNIRHGHRLTWTVRGTVAGEQFNISGGQSVDLVVASDERGQGPVPPAEGSSWQTGASLTLSSGEGSDSWIRPPAEHDGPPTFEDVLEDDERCRVLGIIGTPAPPYTGPVEEPEPQQDVNSSDRTSA
ncbi:hypothetical protein AK830_g7867 [Neonectria ditissima]|uniref:Arrestin-like N-terminal domain-containing protein n=1 Tax=Neonectria ditissima TaxID=78410 RepID=A0A0P7AW00_9HYPO|nr:hypothetical protein AK830_g7867 [Neonectria ditissima]